MILEMVKGNRLIVRIQRSYAADATYSFSLIGFTKAITPALKACNYDLKEELSKVQQVKDERKAREKKAAEIRNTPTNIIASEFEGKTRQ